VPSDSYAVAHREESLQGGAPSTLPRADQSEWMSKSSGASTSDCDAMSSRLYGDLFTNPETFKTAQQYWKRLTAAIADSLGQAGQWHQWNPRSYVDGRPLELEDQEVWDGRSERFDRAFQIYQVPPTGREPQLAAWLSFVEPEWGSPLPRETLVLRLVLSEKTARLAEKLLRKWMTPETAVEEMKVFIAEHAPERSSSDSGE